LNFIRNSRGATAVEFALVSPIFLLLLFGIFEFGLMQHRLASIRHAVNVASRALVIDSGTSQAALQEIVTSELAKTARTNVQVALTILDVAEGKAGRLTARYEAVVGVPGLATFKIPYEITTTTLLR